MMDRYRANRRFQAIETAFLEQYCNAEPYKTHLGAYMSGERATIEWVMQQIDNPVNSLEGTAEVMLKIRERLASQNESADERCILVLWKTRLTEILFPSEYRGVKIFSKIAERIVVETLKN